jgi:8-oxo-dGTP pyrophosphatase MutT (NUDIX family)
MSGDNPVARWVKDAEGREPAPMVAAATVILLRDGADGLETLMLRRDSKLAFAGGMWVFPGGRVDPGDYGDDPEDLDTASRNAAVRESFEESGLVVTADVMVPFAHWTPPPEAPKRFSTQFFVAPAPEGVGPRALHHPGCDDRRGPGGDVARRRRLRRRRRDAGRRPPPALDGRHRLALRAHLTISGP